MNQELYFSFCKLMDELGKKDPITFYHSSRVAKIAMFFAKEIGLSKKERQTLEIGALLHDIGKIKIDGSILNKSGKLTKEEFDEVKKHPVYGFEILENRGISEVISQLALYHHERWDGKGYPYGLAGEEIPFLSRLLSLADTLEAMTGIRPYREPFTWKKAYVEIDKNAGTQFDPQLVKEFLKWMEKKEFVDHIKAFAINKKGINV